jgi:hypothetical protein
MTLPTRGWWSVLSSEEGIVSEKIIREILAWIINDPTRGSTTVVIT